jgi:hypothetical protein
MPHVWVLNQGEWAVIEMREGRLDLTQSDPSRRFLDGLQIQHAREGHVLLSLFGEHVEVNGRPIIGICRLNDRDELRRGDQRAFFSTESLPQVEPFAEDHATPCARCRVLIEPGCPTVRCPSCGASYHQTEKSPCFDYGPECTLCSGETSLGPHQEYRWIPEGL